MKTKYENLFTPFKVGNLEIKNRIALAPMAGNPVDPEEYYIEIARGGAGLLVSGTNVAQNKIDLAVHCVFDDPALFITKQARMMEKIHAYGAKMFLQITAGLGRNIPPFIMGSRELKSASDGLPNVWTPAVKTKEMSVEEIQMIVQAFAKDAKLAQMAGYDGVEVHAVHEGYLLDQFALTCTNNRKDQYGGSLENRARFAVEVLQAIKQTCGENFPVSLRYSVRSYMKDFNSGAVFGEKFKEFGRDLAEGIELAKHFEKAGYDMLNCDNGTYDSWYWAHPPVYMPEGFNVDDVYEVKKAVKIPVLVAGRLEKPELGEQVLKEGKADAISIGRQLLADPQYPNKIKEDRFEDVKPCIACHIGCLGRAFQGKNRSCAVNPACGNERYHDLKPAAPIKNIMIVGGGMAGMEAALVASARGHKVCLYEKSAELGGAFIAAAAFDFKEADRRLIAWYKRQLAKSNVEIQFNKTVDAAFVEQANPDAVILAIGAKERKLPLPGAERAISAIDHLTSNKESGQKVVVIGGGITGSEIAYSLAQQGKDVTIVEMLKELIPDRTLCAANRNNLLELMAFHNVKERVNAKVVKITDKTVMISSNGEESSLEADTVITAAGYVTENSLYRDLCLYVGEVHILGDANNVSNILNAIWSANELARNI